MTEGNYTKDTGARPPYSKRNDRLSTVRVDLRKDLLAELMAHDDDSGGNSLTTLLNSALKVALRHKDLILEDAKSAKGKQSFWLGKDVTKNGHFERA